jgi:hypothetical protein
MTASPPPPIDYPRVLFTEYQRFNRWWHWVIMGGVTLVPLAALSFIFIRFQQARPAFWPLIFVALLPAATLAAVYFVRMGTTVRTDELIVRFFPLRRRIPLAQIESFEPIKYHWMDLGGWGARWNGADWSFTVEGDRAIRLRMRNGKRLLIGTQRIDELTSALESVGVARTDLPVKQPA